ncbi:MAG: hypothetical protein ACREWG_08390 [Gammaproteobacteria bacterium]
MNVTDQTNKIAPAPPSAMATTDLSGLSDHSCFLLYSISYPDRGFPLELDLTLGNLLAPPARDKPSISDNDQQERLDARHKAMAWLTPDAREALSDSQRKDKVWQPALLEVGTDLHPHIRRLLGEVGVAEGESPAQTFRLSDSALRLVQGELPRYPQYMPKEERRPKVLSMKFWAAAQERLAARFGPGAPDTLGMHVEQFRLIVFHTGIGVMIVEVTFHHLDSAPLHPYWLVEAVNSLARFNTLCWFRGGKDSDERRLKELEGADTFTLGSIVRTLSGTGDIGEQARRVFTASYVQFDQAPDPAAARRYAIQLARHYTDHYHMAAGMQGVRFVADFENILHALTIEGSATLVDLTPPRGLTTPEFLKQFKSVTFKRHYLPVLALAFHEFTTLLHLSNDARFWPALVNKTNIGAPETDTLGRLERLRNQILRFRLCYRFSYVSYVNMHNTVNKALREAFGLDHMLHELGQDTAEITAYLEQVISKQTAHKFRLMSAVGAAGLGFLTTLAIVKEGLEVAPIVSHKTAGVVAAGISLLVAIVSGRVTWAKTGYPHVDEHGHGLMHHALEEHVKHVVLKDKC